MCDYKTCSRCKETKPVSEFNKNNRRKNQKPTWSDYKSTCKICTRIKGKEFREIHPHRWIINRYKVPKEVAHEWYLKSMQTCEICGKQWEVETEKLCIDHHHITGKIRGILCKHCNHVLGHSRDNIQILENAIMYLRERG